MKRKGGGFVGGPRRVGALLRQGDPTVTANVAHMTESNAERLSPVILGPSPSHAERARTLVALQRQGTLCTLLAPHLRSAPPRGHDEGSQAPTTAEAPPEADALAGFPYGSIVNFALASDGSPIFLLSTLAEHTRNFTSDPRASLFVHEGGGGSGDVLALGRVTLLGVVARTDDPDARPRYLARHPEAAYYADFKDFAFYCLRVQGIRYIGGFGRMSWTSVDAFAKATADPTTAFAASVISHMNEDHADSLVRLCRHQAGLADTTAAELRAVDRLGFEMNAITPRGPRFVRLGFAAPVETPEQTRAAFVALVNEARNA